MYRSTDTSYTNFTQVHEAAGSIIDRGWAVSPDGVIMYVGYSTTGTIPPGDRQNPSEISAVRATDDGRVWETVFTMNRNAQFEGDKNFIRHFHTIAFDNYTGKWYFSSGDGYSTDGTMANGFEVKFWEMTNDETPIITLLHEGQQIDNAEDQLWRTVSYVFTKDYIIWGTDSPDVQSYYLRYDRQTGLIETRTPVSGSIFITETIQTVWGDILIGNAAVESGAAGMWDDYTRLYICEDGEGLDWAEAYKWQKNPSFGAFARLIQIIDNKDNRFFVQLQNVLDEDGTVYIYESSAIMEVTSTLPYPVTSSPIAYFNDNGKIRKAEIVFNGKSRIQRITPYISENNGIYGGM